MKISSVEYGNPHARVRRECEETIAAEKAAYAQESEAITKESSKLDKARTQLLNKWHKKEISEQEFVDKGRALQARYEAFGGRTVLLQKRQDSIIDAMNRHIGTYDAEIGEYHQKMRALTSLMIGTHKDTAAIRFLHAELGSYQNATDRAEKSRITATISSIFDNAVEFNPTNEVPTVLADLEKIDDPEQRTSFYRQNREQIHEAYSAQQIKTLDESNS